MKRLGVLASGTPIGGGSGFENLVVHSRYGALKNIAEIVVVGSNVTGGGVEEKAHRLEIPFVYWRKPKTQDYQRLVEEYKLDFVALSGYLLLVSGLDPRTTFNIHPGPLPEFGGKGMHGHFVHEAVLAAYRRGEIGSSAVSMHFVTNEYDRGPVFLDIRVPIRADDTPNTLGSRVNEYEHIWQPRITAEVIMGDIYWNGIDPNSLVFPERYQYN